MHESYQQLSRVGQTIAPQSHNVIGAFRKEGLFMPLRTTYASAHVREWQKCWVEGEGESQQQAPASKRARMRARTRVA